MRDERTGHTPESALTELRKRLEGGLARARLTKKDLVARTGLSRTTVQLAFQTNGPVPSLQTVTALAGALRLPAGDRQELEKMQRVAAGGGDAERPGPGRPIGQCDPHALEVHPVGTVRDGSGLPGQRLLPGYVFREHDRILTEAAREAREGYSRMVVLVGESSTGKTRACWEAVQPLAEQGWRLWHPFDPTRAEAAVEDLDLVGPRTVVWLNEAQHYLGDRAGERIAAAVHHLLTSPQRGPVLVLGTLWPDYFRQYTALPAPGGPDPHSRVRELLAGCTVSVPDSFDSRALAAATALAEGGDRLLADSLTRARADGRLTQDLAGGPALLKRYHAGSPAAKALLEVAMDARRLGVGLHLPQAFLTDAAPDYLHDTDWMQLTDDWAEKAYAELAEQVHGNQAPLSRVTPRPQPSGPVFRLADYLEQYGRTTRRHLCPPASFWHAAHTHLAHPDDLYNLTSEALDRHRLQWAHHLQLRAAHCGNTDALCALARMREKAGDREGAETLYRQAADRGNADALYALAQMREKAGDREGAETLARQADDHGFPSAMSRLVGMQENAMSHLVGMREKAGDRVGAETLARQAADRGNTDALYALAQMRENAGDREGAETLYRQAADQGNTSAVCRLVEMREEAGDREDAETLARQAADHGNTNALLRLARTREWAGDREGAETLARQAANHGNTNALYALAFMREWAGDREGAETLFRQAADHGNTDALYGLARMREWAGDREDAEALFRQAADHGNFNALVRLARIRVSPGTREDGDETLAQHAADHGNTDAPARLTWMHEWALTEALLQRKVRDGEGDVALARRAAEGDTSALVRLAQIRERAGDREDAGALYRQAADHGHTDALYGLAQIRERAGDWEGAEALYRQAADHGHTDALYRLAQIRERAGDWEGAEALYRQAADHGHTDALYDLAQIRERVGDWEGAEALYRQAADHGDAQALLGMAMALKRLWPYGLDPDGTPTPEWQ